MPKQIDPFSEFLATLDPSQADALLQMQEIFNNQVAVSTAILSLQNHSVKDGRRIKALEDAQGDN